MICLLFQALLPSGAEEITEPSCPIGFWHQRVFAQVDKEQRFLNGHGAKMGRLSKTINAWTLLYQR